MLHSGTSDWHNGHWYYQVEHVRANSACDFNPPCKLFNMFSQWQVYASLVPDKVIKWKINILQCIRSLPHDDLISHPIILSLWDKVHHMGLMFNAITPKMPWHIAFGHWLMPSMFQVSYCEVNLLKLIMLILFSICHVNAILPHSCEEWCMATHKTCGQVWFEVDRDSNIITKLLEHQLHHLHLH